MKEIGYELKDYGCCNFCIHLFGDKIGSCDEDIIEDTYKCKDSFTCDFHESYEFLIAIESKLEELEYIDKLLGGSNELIKERIDILKNIVESVRNDE